MRILSLLLLLFFTWPCQATLIYSGETLAELPSQWRGFLLDYRALRQASVDSPSGPGLLRKQYLASVDKLTTKARKEALTADETADLGALYIRIGQPGKAIEVLRTGVTSYPESFGIVANLGSAWQLQGELAEALSALKIAVKLAPEKLRPIEELHLKLIRARLKEAKEDQGLDDLFGVKYLGASGKPEAGKIDPVEFKKLPPNAVALLQQLALSLPSDGRLLWQLGELANAHGDIRTAANILDGCVSDFGLGSPDLRRRRQIYRDAADNHPDKEHERTKSDLVMRSTRPLSRQFDASILPKVKTDDLNLLPWGVIDQTVLGRGFKPSFLGYLNELDGQQVSITGFMQPFRADGEGNGFMLLENPIGCWFCEAPDPTGIIAVRTKGDPVAPIRGVIKVTGKLRLNSTDPEDFLYTIEKATVVEAD